MEHASQRRVVIIGGGFAGLAASAALKKSHSVAIVDRAPKFDYLPFVPDLISRHKNAKAIQLSRAAWAKRLGQRFVLGEASSIDFAATKVNLRSGETLPYDALIVAPGGEPALRGTPGARAYALPLRSVADAERIEVRLRALAATRTSSRVTVIGGGLTGIEVVGEILRRYRKRSTLQVTVVDPGPRLLPGVSKRVGRRLRKLMDRHGVDVRFDERVEWVEVGGVTLASGETLGSDLTIWAGGAAAPGFLASCGLTTPDRAWPRARPTLQARGHASVFIAGDAVSLDEPARKQGAEALRMGARAGRNVNRWLAGRTPKSFAAKPGPRFLPFGDLTTFLVLDDGSAIEDRSFAVARELTFQRAINTLEQMSDDTSLRKLTRRVSVLMRGSQLEPLLARKGLPFLPRMLSR